MRISIKRMGSHILPLPAYETTYSAGMDLRANLHGELHCVGAWTVGDDVHPVTGQVERYLELMPGSHAYLPVGFAFEIPAGFEGQVRPRSGLAKKHSVVAWHPIGTIDADYRGEVAVTLHNRGERPFRIWHGDRVAQMVIAPVVRAVLVEVAELSETERGAGGFGHSGTR